MLGVSFSPRCGAKAWYRQKQRLYLREGFSSTNYYFCRCGAKAWYRWKKRLPSPRGLSRSLSRSLARSLSLSRSLSLALALSRRARSLSRSLSRSRSLNRSVDPYLCVSCRTPLSVSLQRVFLMCSYCVPIVFLLCS